MKTTMYRILTSIEQAAVDPDVPAEIPIQYVSHPTDDDKPEPSALGRPPEGVETLIGRFSSEHLGFRGACKFV